MSDTPQNGRKTPRERFLKVAERRTVQILKMFRLLGNCANPSSYEYYPEEADRIFDEIQKELNLARARFNKRREIEFRLR